MPIVEAENERDKVPREQRDAGDGGPRVKGGGRLCAARIQGTISVGPNFYLWVRRHTNMLYINNMTFT